jgi:PD-(D/E)XK nuclease superfamily protein
MVTHTVITSRHSHSHIELPDGSLSVSQSKIKQWRACRLAFHYKYDEHLRPKKTKRPFSFGSIVHDMLEAYAEGDDPFALLKKVELEKGDYFRREIEMYGEIIDDIRIIMTDYFDFWGEKSLVYIRRQGRSSEHPFELEILPGVWVTGRVDATVRARKMRWLMEHKSFSRVPSEGEFWRSVQAVVYFRVFEELGWPEFDGVMWNYISSKPPSLPEKLKSGEWSKRRISTLPARLREFAREEKVVLPPELTETAYENRSNYFFRKFTPVKRSVVDLIWSEFLDTAQEIADLRHKRPTRNIGRHCSWCEFELLCRAEVEGSDVDWLKEHEYVTTDEDSEIAEPVD